MDILKDQQYKNYKKVSRYMLVPTYLNILDNVRQSGFPVQLDTNTPYVFYTTIPGDTLDSISLYFYGNPTYYWLIADFNGILDAFEVILPGTKLKIPSFSQIQFKE